MHAGWKNGVMRNYLINTHIYYSWCPIINTVLEISSAPYRCPKQLKMLFYATGHTVSISY